MEDKNYFNKFCLYEILWSLSSHQRKVQGRHLHMGLLSPVPGQKEEVRNVLLASAVFQVPLTQNNPYAKEAHCHPSESCVKYKITMYEMFKENT